MKKEFSVEDIRFMAERVRQKKYDCNSRNLTFDLSLSHLMDISIEKCPKSKDPLIYRHRKDIDVLEPVARAVLCRKDYNLGFVDGNVEWKSIKTNMFEQGLVDNIKMRSCQVIPFERLQHLARYIW